MSMETIIISAIVTVLSLSLVAISLLSYRKYSNTKLLLIGVVFLFFFIRGVLFSLSLFYDHIETVISSPYIWLFDVIILVLLYITSLKR